MSNKCSIAIAGCKSLSGAIAHNRQRDKLDYVIPNGKIKTLESSSIKDLSLAEVHQFERNKIEELKTIIKDKTGQKSQVKNYYLDGLISLGRDGFEKLTEEQTINLEKKITTFIVTEFQQKLNAKIQHISFHYDEGHKNEEGKWIRNPHVHFTVENVNRNTGKSIQRTFTKAQLKNLQTSLADSLGEFGFERGKDYSANKEQAPKQVYWKDYKRQQEQKTKELTQSKIAELVETKKLQEQIIEQLKEENNLNRQALKDSGTAKQSDYQALKKQLEEQKEIVLEHFKSITVKQLDNSTARNVETEIQKLLLNAFIDGRKSYKKSLERDNSKLKLALINLPTEVVINLNQQSTDSIFNAINEQIGSQKLDKEKFEQALDSFFEIKQKIEEIPIEKEVIVEKIKEVEVEKVVEKIVTKEVPKYVEKIVEIEKKVEKEVIVDIDVNEQLKNQIQQLKQENQRLSSSNHQKELEKKQLTEQLEKNEKFEKKYNNIVTSLEPLVNKARELNPETKTYADVTATIEKDIKRAENLYNSLDSLNQSLQKEINELVQPLKTKAIKIQEQQGNYNPRLSPKQVTETIVNHVTKLETENTLLKTAIERILSIPLVVSMVDTTKSLIERFMQFSESLVSDYKKAELEKTKEAVMEQSEPQISRGRRM